MIQHRGDLHHIFPKEFLKSKGLTKSQYNHVANFVYAQQEINIKIGKKPPVDYFTIIKDQCESQKFNLGNIMDWKDVEKNLKDNSIPLTIVDGNFENYNNFLQERKLMMSNSIKDYYYSL